MTASVRWGILSTGAIARTFAHGLRSAQTGRLVAVGSRSVESAQKFAQEFGQVRAHGSYEALLADKEVDAVYVATPHPMHALWAVRAAEAGKHVLCEKPFALNAPEAMAVFDVAQQRGVFIMEAFMYRCHPQTAKVIELVKSGAIGELRMIQASFGFMGGFNPSSRTYNLELAGGGIMDVGCYPVSFARLMAGVALGRDFADPVEIKASGKLAPTGVDEYTTAILRFEGDILAQVATAVGLNLDNSARLFGTKGCITVPKPWTADRQNGGQFSFELRKYWNPAETITLDCPVTAFTLEADVAGNAIAAKLQQPASPAMRWDDSLGNLRVLDQWRAQVGVVYPSEKRESPTPPVHGRPLVFNAQKKMKYGRVPGVDKDIARLVMGVDNQRFMPQARVIFDAYYELGGNTFDCSYVYGELLERHLGAWFQQRGVRDQIVMLEKGAHTPDCFPREVVRQVHESLERYGLDYFDIWCLHRDNLDVPVGEFVDVLNDLKNQGKIRVFGGSNWTPERMAAANEYARKHNKQGFTVMSNQFSLARMVDPVWKGCIAASDPATRQFLRDTQTTLMPWSSQARGFFTSRADAPAATNPDKELVRCWFSDDNFERRRRAYELAQKKDTQAIVVNLAYVLHQPFPTFPLIGPRSIAELRSSLQALNVTLTPQEVAYLNLEA